MVQAGNVSGHQNFRAARDHPKVRFSAQLRLPESNKRADFLLRALLPGNGLREPVPPTAAAARQTDPHWRANAALAGMFRHSAAAGYLRFAAG